MKATARSILSATTAIGLTAFTTISAFAANASPSIPAMAFGLLAIYGIVEMMISSYAPRRYVTRATTLRMLAPQSTTARVPAMVDFPTRPSRACAA